MRALFLLAIAAIAHAASLEGRVYNGSNSTGIADLTVTLTPPKGSDLPETVTLTDVGGHYAIDEVAAGLYLLRIHQGTTLLLRQQITLDGDITKDVELTLK